MDYYSAPDYRIGAVHRHVGVDPFQMGRATGVSRDIADVAGMTVIVLRRPVTVAAGVEMPSG